MTPYETAEILAEVEKNWRPHFSETPTGEQRLIVDLADALHVASEALDYIITRLTDDDYDNPSSALEAIGNAVEATGRTIVQKDYS